MNDLSLFGRGVKSFLLEKYFFFYLKNAFLGRCTYLLLGWKKGTTTIEKIERKKPLQFRFFDERKKIMTCSWNIDIWIEYLFFPPKIKSKNVRLHVEKYHAGSDGGHVEMLQICHNDREFQFDFCKQ